MKNYFFWVIPRRLNSDAGGITQKKENNKGPNFGKYILR